MARQISRPLGSASRPLRRRARKATQGPPGCNQGSTQMTNAVVKSRVIIERTYEASVGELWDLWTTKEGFESWWGPIGCRVEVHKMEARQGGAFFYDMITD